MNFGYLPPMRSNSVLLTTTRPPHHGCIHPDCQHKEAGCLGNRVYRHPSSGTWALDVPHHKNTKRWSGVAMKLALPQEVATLMDHHITWGHRALTICVEEPSPTLFVNKATGGALKPQEASKLWKDVVLEGTGLQFSPHMCRSIFVVGTKDSGVTIPKGMAMMMGSSQDTIWQSTYDKHFNQREVKHAIDNMPSWRHSMLVEAKKRQGAPQHHGPKRSKAV